MVSSGTVNSSLDKFLGDMNDYSSSIESLSGSWKGKSHDELEKQATSFANRFKNSLENHFTTFAEACDLYKKYEEMKETIEKLEVRKNDEYDSWQSAKKSDNSVTAVYHYTMYKKFSEEIDGKIEEQKKLKEQINGLLDSVTALVDSRAAAKEAAGSSTAGAGAGVSNTATGHANELGGDSGVLPNARIGEAGRPDPSTNMFFQNEANGGINGYPLNGRGIPGQDGNCTYYAYSRFSELLGHEATGIADGDACSWYANTKGYKKGSSPKLGAIAVWQYGNSNSAGHVAVVEKIKDNGDIVVSEGGWSNNKWYGNSTFKKSNDYATGYNNGHLLGFIYPEET